MEKTSRLFPPPPIWKNQDLDVIKSLNEAENTNRAD